MSTLPGWQGRPRPRRGPGPGVVRHPVGDGKITPPALHVLGRSRDGRAGSSTGASGHRGGLDDLRPAAHAVAPSTVRASLTATGAEILAYNALPSVSQDGRWVAFDSYSDAVVPGDANGLRDVFLRDMQTGAVRRVSALPDGTSANGPSGGSSDERGRALDRLRAPTRTNLAPGPNTALDDVYLYDRVTGSLRRVSTSLTGKDGAGTSRAPRVASDGTHLVFESTANDLVAGDTRDKDAFIADVATLALRRASVRADGGEPSGDSYSPDVSDGGRLVAFTSLAADVVPGDANAKADVFVRDLAAGATTRQSVSASGGEGNGDSVGPDITADGCTIAFASLATNLVSNFGAGLKAMVRNRCASNTEVAGLTRRDGAADRRAARLDLRRRLRRGVRDLRADRDTRPRCHRRHRAGPLPGHDDPRRRVHRGRARQRGRRLHASQRGHGALVAFDSGATNLVARDNGNSFDAFVRDRGNATPPIADLTVSVNGLRVNVDGTASRDPDNRIASASIAFGDGSADQAGLNAIHDYARAGTFTVTLVVTDADALTTITSRNVTVGPGVVSGPAPPAAGDVRPALDHRRRRGRGHGPKARPGCPAPRCRPPGSRPSSATASSAAGAARRCG